MGTLNQEVLKEIPTQICDYIDTMKKTIQK